MAVGWKCPTCCQNHGRSSASRVKTIRRGSGWMRRMQTSRMVQNRTVTNVFVRSGIQVHTHTAERCILHCVRSGNGIVFRGGPKTRRQHFNSRTCGTPGGSRRSGRSNDVSWAITSASAAVMRFRVLGVGLMDISTVGSKAQICVPVCMMIDKPAKGNGDVICTVTPVTCLI